MTMNTPTDTHNSDTIKLMYRNDAATAGATNSNTKLQDAPRQRVPTSIISSHLISFLKVTLKFKYDLIASIGVAP
jgi:hypothetical protein